MTFLVKSMNEYFGYPQSVKKTNLKNYKYDMAILYNPEEEIPPSDKGAIEQFISAAKDLRISAEVIGNKDIGNLNRFDGLFIRETTDIMNHTFHFAKKAEMEGLIVIDDSQSIVRCCNKVFLHDLLSKKSINTPQTTILYKNKKFEDIYEYPLIVKKPDSAFSAGVKKVNNFQELKACTDEFFKGSDLLITQEYMPTEFDWRIGVLNNEPLYACKYYMSSGHWQIINREGNKTREGNVETFDVHTVPSEAVRLALRACKAIGDSLYGVDIKERDGEFYVIEVNDNPSIEKGCEDKILGQNLYKRIVDVFYNRMESR
ncbi:MAG: RimK family alpha-L-glutamate ligase [Bdellovibrionales bacterium]